MQLAIRPLAPALSISLLAQFSSVAAVKLYDVEIVDKRTSLCGGKKYMLFYGHQLVKRLAVCYIRNFVILELYHENRSAY